MIVSPAPTFLHPTLFLIGGRAADTGGNPVEPVGVLIVKQAFTTAGAPVPMPVPPADEESPLQILMKDVPYPGTDQIKYESDLAPIKPSVDLVVVRDASGDDLFPGWVTINPGETDERGPFFLHYGWRERTEDLRLLKAALDEDTLKDFRPVEISDPLNPPPLEDILKVPAGFQNSFFNAAPFVNTVPAAIDAPSGAPLSSGDVVRYTWIVLSFPPQIENAAVTIPTAPALRVTLGGAATPPPEFHSSGVDTVVLDLPRLHILLTWRFVFTWEPRFELATLEVS